MLSGTSSLNADGDVGRRAGEFQDELTPLQQCNHQSPKPRPPGVPPWTPKKTPTTTQRRRTWCDKRGEKLGSATRPFDHLIGDRRRFIRTGSKPLRPVAHRTPPGPLREWHSRAEPLSSNAAFLGPESPDGYAGYRHSRVWSPHSTASPRPPDRSSHVEERVSAGG